MKKLAIALILTATIFAGNCAIGPVGGVLFQSTKFPGEINPAQDVKEIKTGTSCASSLLGLFAWGDASTKGAADAGGIRKVSTVDHEGMTVLLLLYQSYCTTVSGE